MVITYYEVQVDLSKLLFACNAQFLNLLLRRLDTCMETKPKILVVEPTLQIWCIRSSFHALYVFFGFEPEGNEAGSFLVGFQRIPAFIPLKDPYLVIMV